MHSSRGLNNCHDSHQRSKQSKQNLTNISLRFITSAAERNIMDGNTTYLPTASLTSTVSPPKSQDTTLNVTFWVIAALSFTSNLLFCIVLLRKRSMLRKAHNILLFSLAVVDLLTGEFHKPVLYVNKVALS